MNQETFVDLFIHTFNQQLFKARLCWEAGDKTRKADIQPLLINAYERLKSNIHSDGLVFMLYLVLNNTNATNGYSSKQVFALVDLIASWQERESIEKNQLIKKSGSDKSHNTNTRGWCYEGNNFCAFNLIFNLLY